MTREEVIKQNEIWMIGMSDKEKRHYLKCMNRFIKNMGTTLDEFDSVSIPPHPIRYTGKLPNNRPTNNPSSEADT